MDKNMKTFMLMCLKPNEREKVFNTINQKSKEEISELFERIVNSNPFNYKPAVEIIVNKFYSDDKNFVILLSKLIEKITSDMACGLIMDPISKIAVERSEITMAIYKKMNDLDIAPSLSSAFIISPLLGLGIIDKVVISNLESKNHALQREALIAICNSFLNKNEKAIEIYIPRLLKVIRKIDQQNTDALIQCLLAASRIKKENILPVLEKEIDERGYTAAINFIRLTSWREDTPIELLKKAIRLVETENPDREIIDEALGRIYKEDPDFVVERLRARLNENQYSISDGLLAHQIQTIGVRPVLKMLEEEIDGRNPRMMYLGESILDEFFASNMEWLEWCRSRKDDEKKELIILNSLAHILTDILNRKSKEECNFAISLVKDIANKKGLNYEEETKLINFGKEKTEDIEYRESIIKALYLLQQILHPPDPINIESLKENLKIYPNICKAIDAKWLEDNAKSKKPHILAYIYERKVDLKRMEELTKLYENETSDNNKMKIAREYESLAYIARQQQYWEDVFKTLYKHNIRIKRQELRNNGNNYLAEAEVAARLVPHFDEIKVGSDIEEFKNLDLQIKLSDEIALIEIATVQERIELSVAHGGLSLSSGKVKNVLLNKFQTQLKNGEIDPGVPIIMILNLQFLMLSHEVEDAIYGQEKFYYKSRTDTHELIERGLERADNSFYQELNTDIVAAIAAYKREITKGDPLVGILYLPPKSVNPRNPLSKGFRLRLRNALFGKSENSNWRSLLKVDGINEDTALKLHSEGIEDLGILATATEEEITIDGFDIKELLGYQKEARRIINALSTNSIRFLKGINQDIFNLMIKNGVYLIDQILEISEPPNGVPPEAWSLMIDDAKALLKYEDKEEI